MINMGLVKATPLAAGYDLPVYGNHMVYPGETKLIPTGVSITFPPRIFGMIFGRSSTALKKKLLVIPGVIDNDYTGELMISVTSLDEHYVVKIKDGSRIAQLVPFMHLDAELPINEIIVKEARGERGFGSTG